MGLTCLIVCNIDKGKCPEKNSGIRIFSRTHVDKQKVTQNLENTELKLEFLMGRVDVEKRNEVRISSEETQLWFDRYEPCELPF
jgi:hypothetical protein